MVCWKQPGLSDNVMKIKFHLKIDVFVALQALISVEILQPKIEELKIRDFNVFSCFWRQKFYYVDGGGGECSQRETQ